MLKKFQNENDNRIKNFFFLKIMMMKFSKIYVRIENKGFIKNNKIKMINR